MAAPLSSTNLSSIEIAKQYLVRACDSDFDRIQRMCDQQKKCETLLKDGKTAADCVQVAADIKLRCEREIGRARAQFGAQGRRKSSGNDSRKAKEDFDKAFSLDSRKARDWQKHAELPDEVYEAYAAATVVTTEGALTLSKKSEHDRQAIIAALRRGRTMKDILGHLKLVEKDRLRNHIRDNPPKYPDGIFDVASIDPAWMYDARDEHVYRAGNSPYPAMTTDEIIARTPVETVMAPDSVIFLHTPNKHLTEGDALRCITSWKYTPKVTLTWDKIVPGLGRTFAHVTEFIIMAVRGSPEFIRLPENWTTLLSERKREHSRKPDIFYQMVEEMFPNRRKLEMYSRSNRPGWEHAGVEAGKFDDSEAAE